MKKFNISFLIFNILILLYFVVFFIYKSNINPLITKCPLYEYYYAQFSAIWALLNLIFLIIYFIICKKIIKNNILTKKVAISLFLFIGLFIITNIALFILKPTGLGYCVLFGEEMLLK